MKSWVVIFCFFLILDGSGSRNTVFDCGAGDDYFEGYDGIYTGGSGNDVFDIELNFVGDYNVITDFNPDEDTLSLAVQYGTSLQFQYDGTDTKVVRELTGDEIYDAILVVENVQLDFNSDSVGFF